MGIKLEDHAWENGTRKLDFQYDCWQYSSDGNGQGAAYGVESADIDLDYWYTNGTLSNGEYSVCDGIYTISSNLNKNMVLIYHMEVELMEQMFNYINQMEVMHKNSK